MYENSVAFLRVWCFCHSSLRFLLVRPLQFTHLETQLLLMLQLVTILLLSLKLVCSDTQLREALNRSIAVAWIGGQDLAKLFPFCNGWSPVALQAAVTSVPSHRHYLYRFLATWCWGWVIVGNFTGFLSVDWYDWMWSFRVYEQNYILSNSLLFIAAVCYSEVTDRRMP